MMDVAKHLAQWQEQPREQWFRAANRYLPPGVTTVLVIAIAYQLAALTWALAPGGVPIAELSAGRATSTRPVTAPPASYEALVTTPLFGEALNASVQPALPLVDAPGHDAEPRAHGNVVGRPRWPSDHLHQSRRAEDLSRRSSHRQCERCDAVCRLLRPRVVESRRSARDSAAGAHRRHRGAAVEHAGRAFGRRAGERRFASYGNRSKSTAAHRRRAVRAAHPRGQGRRLPGEPGRDRESFVALGFMPGDIVTEVNGIVLDGARSGSQVFEALAEATTANVTVLREGAATVLVIDTSQLQNLRPGNDGGN